MRARGGGVYELWYNAYESLGMRSADSASESLLDMLWAGVAVCVGVLLVRQMFRNSMQYAYIIF